MGDQKSQSGLQAHTARRPRTFITGAGTTNAQVAELIDERTFTLAMRRAMATPVGREA